MKAAVNETQAESKREGEIEVYAMMRLSSLGAVKLPTQEWVTLVALFGVEFGVGHVGRTPDRGGGRGRWWPAAMSMRV